MSKQFPKELWDNEAFHKGREYERSLFDSKPYRGGRHPDDVRKEEQDRIIALFEAAYVHIDDLAASIASAIALIKGETK